MILKYFIKNSKGHCIRECTDGYCCRNNKLKYAEILGIDRDALVDLK